MENIMLIHFTETIGSHEIKKVAIFDKAVISEEQVVDAINDRSYNTHNQIIVVNQENYDAVFGFLHTDETE